MPASPNSLRLVCSAVFLTSQRRRVLRTSEALVQQLALPAHGQLQDRFISEFLFSHHCDSAVPPFVARSRSTRPAADSVLKWTLGTPRSTALVSFSQLLQRHHQTSTNCSATSDDVCQGCQLKMNVTKPSHAHCTNNTRNYQFSQLPEHRALPIYCASQLYRLGQHWDNNARQELSQVRGNGHNAN